VTAIPGSNVHDAVRDMSTPSGLPGDGQHRDTTEEPREVRAVAPRTGPRHLAAPSTDARRAPGGASDDGSDDAEEPDEHPGHGIGRTVLEWLAVIACGVLIALTAQAFLVQAFWIPSESMVPTLEVGDRVLVNKLAYKAHDVNHGDLIVFERPPEAAQAGQEDIKDLIKRVIAVGGDTVESRNGLVYVNGERIEEPYLVEGTPTERLPLTPVPEGEVFVMGDNRTNSEDSRDFGPIDEDTIVGRAVVKVLPLSDIGWL
jgi:signal peptidase I